MISEALPKVTIVMSEVHIIMENDEWKTTPIMEVHIAKSTKYTMAIPKGFFCEHTSYWHITEVFGIEQLSANELIIGH